MQESEEKEKTLKEKTMSGMLWRFAERCGAQGVTFLVSVLLARILSPDDYGIIAMVTVFITISQVFVDSGLGTALIQKKNSDDIDFSTVFYFNIILCCVLYVIVFISAPYIAKFYMKPELTNVLRVLGITIIISALKNVQQAYVSKKMLFKKFFFATLGGTVFAAILGIIIALLGGGVWALVIQQITNVLIDTLILWITVRWRPKKTFSFIRLKRLLSYGWKVLISSLITTIYMNLRQLIIGKVYSSSELAYYNKGYQFPNLFVTNINSSIDSVLLPAMSNEQDNVARVKQITRLSIRVSSYVMWPLMCGLCVIANPLVLILLTEKWIEVAPFLQIFCFALVLEPIQTANLNAIKAMGRSDILLKIEMVKKMIGIIILFLSVQFGVFYIAIGVLLYSVLASIINSFPNRILLGYGYLEQVKDILPSIGLSITMMLVILPFQMWVENSYLRLVLQILIGGIFYVGCSHIFSFDPYLYIKNIISQIRVKNK